MDLEQAQALARRLMDEHGLHDWAFRFNRRKRALGLCHYDLKRIEIAAGYASLNDEQEVAHTVLHEIAHALVGKQHGHGRTWKAMAVRLGVEPRSRARAHVRLPATKWRAQCRGCGREFGRERRPRNRAVYWCRSCGPEKGRLSFCLAPVGGA